MKAMIHYFEMFVEYQYGYYVLLEYLIIRLIHVLDQILFACLHLIQLLRRR